MDFRYKIIEENGEQVLCVYLDHYFEEFSRELGAESEERKQNLNTKIQDFIKSKNINFTGNIVKVLAGSLVVATLALTPGGGFKKASAAMVQAPQTYQVQPGDSLWRIATNYGLSVDDLKARNDLTTNVIQPGQTLNVGTHSVNSNVYVVQSGDSLWKLANNSNLSIDQIKEYNNLTSDNLQIGQTLLLMPNAQVGTYTVQQGDTLWSIAQKYGISVNDLKTLNNTTGTIYPGQKLKVIEAKQAKTYTVKSGDSLWSIANTNRVTIQALQNANNLQGNVIYPGQTLTIPAVAPAPAQTTTPAPTQTPPTTTNQYNITTIRVRRYNGVVENIPLEQYVTGVVASELGPGFNDGAYKAQALAARTYAMKLTLEGQTLSDTDSHQVYHDQYQLQQLWGADFNRDYSIIQTAVNETSGQVIEYNGQLIDALFFSTSNGRTENPVYVWGGEEPYLKSVDSHWDTQSPYFYKESTFTYYEFASRLGISSNGLYATVLSRTDGGGVNTINIGGRTFSGEYVRSHLGLRSTDYDISFANGTVTIAQRGWGHRVGLSQYGAYFMAKEGYSYQQIIEHYYQGVDIVQM